MLSSISNSCLGYSATFRSPHEHVDFIKDVLPSACYAGNLAACGDGGGGGGGVVGRQGRQRLDGGRLVNIELLDVGHPVTQHSLQPLMCVCVRARVCVCVCVGRDAEQTGDIYLVIHNIDGPMLRGDMQQVRQKSDDCNNARMNTRVFVCTCVVFCTWVRCMGPANRYRASPAQCTPPLPRRRRYSANWHPLRGCTSSLALTISMRH